MFDGSASHTSTSLIRKAQARDDEAWNRLVSTYTRRVYRWSRSAGLQAADASNVVQEVLRAVARRLPDFQHGRDGDTFRGWIRRITQNKLKDHFRDGYRSEQAIGGTNAYRLLTQVPALEETGSSCVSSSRASRQLKKLDIEQVQLMFSHRDWQMFWRVVVEGEPTGEVANDFRVTPNTVRIVKMRVLKELKSRLSAPSD